MKASRKNSSMSYITKLSIRRFLYIGFVFVFAFVISAFAVKPANAANIGGALCQIDASANTLNSGKISDPASITVRFRDANGNPIKKAVNYTLKSVRGANLDQPAKNISGWNWAPDSSSNGTNTWRESVSELSSSTCGSTAYNYTTGAANVPNFDRFSWGAKVRMQDFANVNRQIYSGNGWLLFCHDHVAGGGYSEGDPNYSNGQPSYFRVTDIGPLPTGGGAGGGEPGSWQFIKADGTSSPSNTAFTVKNGTTKDIILRWVPIYAKITINKYYNGSQASSAEFTTIKNATVAVYKNDGSSLYNSDSGWASKTLSSVPKTGNSYRIRFYIPVSYKVKTLQFGTTSVSCTTQTTSTGEKYCLTPAFNVDPPGVSTINAYYEKIAPTTASPYLVLQCDIGSNITDVSFVKPDRFYLRGYGVDGTNQDEPPTIVLKEGTNIVATYSGNLQNNAVYSALSSLKTGSSSTYTGLNSATEYRLVQEIPDSLRDDKSHSLKVYLKKADGTLWDAANMNPITGWNGTIAWGKAKQCDKQRSRLLGYVLCGRFERRVLQQL